MFKKYLLYIAVILLVSCSVEKKNDSLSIVELVDMDYRFSTQALSKFCSENGIDSSDIYQWQNHWVIYGQMNTKEIAEKLVQSFPRLKINTYEAPFYNFNREQQTHEKPASKWTNIIMTANLVSDTLKQKEYLEYHRTQFEKWPELSKGFCNAHFQQLLVFRSGRQLMLVISIPKGKTLDELNPKTTEKNPRVNDWNKIMANYQEGIEDAPKGSTWVMFNSINR